MLPCREAIGRLIADPEQRRRWLALVEELHAASLPGQPLEGWLFHGTSSERAGKIMTEGVTTTEVMMRDMSEASSGQAFAWWTDGTYWGTAAIAAFYAEDRIESTGDNHLDLAFVAARLDDLRAEGEMAVDEQTLDSPLAERLGRDVEALYREWEATAQRWEDCLGIYGSVVCLAPVGPEHVRIIKDVTDLQQLLERGLAAEAAPALR